MRDWLEQLEAARPAGDELLAVLVYVAGKSVAIGEDELAPAIRRALFVHAAGGDPHRELTLAADLDSGERRAELGRALAALRDEAVRLPLVRDALGRLLADTELAWRTFAIALLAEELAEE